MKWNKIVFWGKNVILEKQKASDKHFDSVLRIYRKTIVAISFCSPLPSQSESNFCYDTIKVSLPQNNAYHYQLMAAIVSKQILFLIYLYISVFHHFAATTG